MMQKRMEETCWQGWVKAPMEDGDPSSVHCSSKGITFGWARQSKHPFFNDIKGLFFLEGLFF